MEGKLEGDSLVRGSHMKASLKQQTGLFLLLCSLTEEHGFYHAFLQVIKLYCKWIVFVVNDPYAIALAQKSLCVEMSS